ncbi:AAA-like domain-containing protein [bacterium]|nr:AAA-like domain-containing protein [bacterium]
MPRRTFITGGPVVPEENYFVKREHALKDFLQRVEGGKYIVIFAPRQTGKTTFFYQALKVLENDPNYIPISLDFEIYSRAEPERFYQIIGIKIINRIEERLEALDIPDWEIVNAWLSTQEMIDHFSFGEFFESLQDKLPNRKVFLIIDEFDGIPPDALRDFLYTLRQIYHEKRLNPSHNYIHSVGIVGVKSIAQLDFDHTISPFNIQDQFAIENFTVEQVAELYGQYTEEVGQPFAPEVIEAVHQKTAGQPFLVNRLGQILTTEMNIPQKITLKHFQEAYAILLKDENTHFDTLVKNIRLEPEFKTILLDIIAGQKEMRFNRRDKNVQSLVTFGVLKEKEGLCVIDNPAYQSIIIDAFSPFINGVEDKYLPEDAEDFTDYLSKSGEIQMDELLNNFRDFIGRAGYKILEVPETPQEFVGQYLLLTYLDLFVRKIGGHLYPEVPTGRGRMDIILLYRNEKQIVETKLWRGEKRYQSGKRQLAAYLDKEGVQRGYYIVFDHRQNAQPQYEREVVAGKEIISYCIPIPA